MSCGGTISWFIEIEAPENEEVLPDRIECFIIENIDPTICGPLSKDLSALLPLRCTSGESTNTEKKAGPRTDHLKRTRRRNATEHELKSRSDTQRHKLSSSSNDGTASCDEKKVKSGDAVREESNCNNHTEVNLNNSNKRKQKERSKQTSSPWSLDILVGSVQHVNEILNTMTTTQNASYPSLLEILAKYELSEQSPNFKRQLLPGRPAKTKEERDEWNKYLWPTLFFEKKTSKFKREEMALTSAEIALMKKGIQEAVSDAMEGNTQWNEWKEQIKPANEGGDLSLSISGAVIVDPKSGSIVSRASKERMLQGSSGNVANSWTSFPDYINPLSTAPLLSIQGVSRIERQAALSNGMESNEFRCGQYLCTGYDVYLTKEPSVFEAMSLVHSRVRRVIFGIPDEGMGGLGGSSGRNVGIHSLPGTNHHYRAFRLNLSDDNDDCNVDDMSRKSLVTELINLHSQNMFADKEPE